MRAAGGKGRVGYLYYILHLRTDTKLTIPVNMRKFCQEQIGTGTGSRLHRSASHIIGRSPDVNLIASRIPPGHINWLLDC